MEVKLKLNRFKLELIPLKKVLSALIQANNQTYVGVFRLINRPATIYLKVEKIGREYMLIAHSDPS